MVRSERIPTERDYGAHAKTIALGERLVVDAGVINGQRLGERTLSLCPISIARQT